MKPTIVLVHGAFVESASWGNTRRTASPTHKEQPGNDLLAFLNSTADVSELVGFSTERTTHEH